MKQYMNKVWTLAVMLLTAVGAWAGDVTVIVNPSGSAGSVNASQAAAGETCTLTVTPASGYYITVENLSAVTTLAGGGVQAPAHRAGSIDIGGETLTITATDTDADPSGVTTYTFTMPADENLNVEVTAEFQTLIAITPSVTLEGWTYGEQPNTPVVSGNSGSGEVTFTYATKGSTTFATAVPENAGEYTVKASVAAAMQYAAGEATADFTISKASITFTKTPAAVETLVYTGEAQALITAGVATGGELQYKLGADGTYGTTVPTATAAGSYTVYYKVVGDANHNDVAEASINVTIGQADLNEVDVAAIANQVYTGEAIEPALTVTFNDEAVDASEYIVAYTNNTNVGEATVTLTSTEKNFSAQNTKSVTFQITTASATLMATDKTVIYTGQAQAIEGVAASKGTAVVTYYATAEARTAGTGGTADAPTNAATYYVQVTQGDNNYASTPVNVTFTIEPKELTEQMVALSATSFVYSGEVQKPTVTVSDGDALTTDDYTITNEGGIAVGTYSVAVVGQNNYTGEVTLDFSITAAGITLTKAPAAIANLTYTGEAQALITAGEVTVGELHYSLAADGQYSTAIPTATNAGTYTVYYKVVADANYTTPEGGEVTASIAKAEPTLTLNHETMEMDLHEPDATYTNAVDVLLGQVSVLTDDMTFRWESSDENVVAVDKNGVMTVKGLGEATITVTGPLDHQNYSAVSKEFKVSVYTTYGLVVDGVAVTNKNRHDVLGDEGSVIYNSASQLVLKNATLTQGITTSYADLTIYLVGTNSITTEGPAIKSTASDGVLTFTTEGNEPGNLTMTCAEGQTVISGFDKVAYEQNLAVLKGAADKNEMTIGTPVAPIVTTTEEQGGSKEVEVGNITEEQQSDLSNTIIDDVLYTLDENHNDGVNNEEQSVELGSTMVEDNVNNTVTTYTPGTEDFAQNFAGLTFMVPAGTGVVKVTAKTGEKGVLHVKIGTEEPYVVTGALDFTEYEFPYAVTEATYVYIYNASPVESAEAPGRRASKKTSITIGIRNVGASASEVQSSNNENAGEVNSESEEEMSDEEVKEALDLTDGVATISNVDVTSLPDDIFSGAGFLNSIDLRETSITGMTVSRSEGAFKNVSQNTFIFMPTGNKSDEPNVVFGKVCENAVLDGNMPDGERFAPADGFTAQKIVLDRTFAEGEIATIYLPVAVTMASAEQFGDFYVVDRIENGYVKVQKVEDNLEANVPYIFQSKTNNMSIELRAVRVQLPDEHEVAPAPRRAGSDNLLHGCYETTGAVTDAFVLTAGTDINSIKFERMQGDAKVKAFQAYLDAKEVDGDELSVTDNEGVITGISEVKTADGTTAVWYTVDGKRLNGKPSAKGVYIVDGKKQVLP